MGVCLVVGAGDGVGGAIARAFGREGLEVCITRRARNIGQLEELAQSIRDDGGKAHAYGVDARSEDEMIALFDRIEREVGPLEVVVFNIGANVRFELTETTSRVSLQIVSLIFRPISAAGPKSCSLPVTSKKASSKDNGSTRGVNRSNISRICRETST